MWHVHKRSTNFYLRPQHASGREAGARQHGCLPLAGRAAAVRAARYGSCAAHGGPNMFACMAAHSPAAVRAAIAR